MTFHPEMIFQPISAPISTCVCTAVFESPPHNREISRTPPYCVESGGRPRPSQPSPDGETSLSCTCRRGTPVGGDAVLSGRAPDQV